MPDQSDLELLIEGIGNYSPPSNPKFLCFDFYCLYALAYRYGALWAQYHGHLPQTPVYARIEHWVNEAFDIITQRIKALMLSTIPKVCLSEAFHCLNFTDELMHGELPSSLGSQNLKSLSWDELHGKVSEFISTITTHSAGEALLLTEMVTFALQNLPTEGESGVFRHWGKDESERLLPEFIDKVLHGEINLRAVQDIFLLNWDDAYGGQQWYRIAALTQELKDAKQTKDEVFRIDQLYDIQHNTGKLLVKIPELDVSEKLLTIRAALADPRDFAPYISPQCGKILTAFARIIQGPGDAEPASYVAPDPLVILEPMPNRWAVYQLEKWFTPDGDPVWGMQFKNRVSGNVAGETFTVTGTLLHGLQTYQNQYNAQNFLVLPEDVTKGIGRFIPAIPQVFPLTGSRSSAGWKVSAPGFHHDGQLWPLDALRELNHA